MNFAENVPKKILNKDLFFADSPLDVHCFFCLFLNHSLVVLVISFLVFYLSDFLTVLVDVYSKC